MTSADRETGLGRLLSFLGRYLWRYRLLVLAVVALTLVRAVLEKAPFLLIKEVSDLLWPSEVASHNWFLDRLVAFKNTLLAPFGLVVTETGGVPDATAQSRILVGSAILLAILAMLGALVIYVFKLLANLAATRFIVDLRGDLCSHLMRLSLRYFGSLRAGDLISRISNDVNTVRHAFTLAFENAILEPVMILGNIAIAFSISPHIGWANLCLVPLLALPMGLFGRKVRKGSGKSLEALGEATDAMSQMFGGFRTVKAFGLEAQEVDEFERVNTRFLRRTMRMVRAKSASQSLLYLLYMLAFAGVLFGLASWFLDLVASWTPGDFLLAMAPLGTTYGHVKRMTRTFNLLKESQGALDRIQQIFDLESDVRDLPEARAVDALEGEIRFENVTFAYEDEPVLRDLSFTVAPGERVAFVGPSGAGKSTVLNLVARFYDPSEGAVLVDGVDLRELELASWLARLAIVDQSPFLFNRTIRENILLGLPGASEDEMLDASRAALVDDFVRDLPQGYDTVVGERGSRLSGGQLQRITIARALIRDPKVLLLDEATSALDTESEQLVQVALDGLMRGRTCFVIAHRLSTVRDADRIFVLEDGAIAEIGSHTELMARPASAYRRLSLLQS